MLLPTDALTHVPALSGKIIEPEKSFFRLARERYVGSSLEYLDNLAERLELLGFSDPALDEVRLHARRSLPSPR